jgi:hypothetical protein
VQGHLLAAIIGDAESLLRFDPIQHASWQRGVNENTNGLIRQSSPKVKTSAFSLHQQV